jgi:hypothetical protein
VAGPLSAKPPTGGESDKAAEQHFSDGIVPVCAPSRHENFGIESGPGQTARFVTHKILLPSATDVGWRAAKHCIPSAGERSSTMGRASRPTTYLTVEELHEMAAAKFEEAAALSPGPEQQEILKKAYGFKSLADMKTWLCTELRPPT